MKEYIMSFFNAPVTNKIPTCICSVAGLHTYISTNPQLEELTRKVRAGLGNKQVFRKNKQTLFTVCHSRQVSSLTAKSNACKFLRASLS